MIDFIALNKTFNKQTTHSLQVLPRIGEVFPVNHLKERVVDIVHPVGLVETELSHILLILE